MRLRQCWNSSVELIRTGEQAVPERAECHVEHVVGFAVQLAPCLQVNEPLIVSDPGRAKDALADVVAAA